MLWLRIWVRNAPFAIGILAAGCAVPPERAERELALRSAIEPCLQRYPSVKLTGIDDYGRVYARAPERLWGLSRLADQQLAGLTMASEQAVVFFAVFAFFFLRFLRDEEPALDLQRARS